MSDLQASLLAIDAELEKVQKLGAAALAAVRRARTVVKTGQVSEIPKALAVIGSRVSETVAPAEALPAQWNFDVAAYLADGRFLRDLKEAAAQEGLSIFEKDGRLYCFPLLLRIEPKELGVRIGRKLERRLNPTELVRLLFRAQKARQRFTEQQFLDLLYRCWRQIVGSAPPSSGPGPAVALTDIYEALTLFPGTEYTASEFALDLLRLDGNPHLVTKDGAHFELPASTLSKGRAKRITAYDAQGHEHAYVGIRFVRDQ